MDRILGTPALTLYTVPCKIGSVGKKNRIQWDKDRLRALRLHLGMTQSQLAGELGTRQQTISEWETGMYQPRGTSVTLLTLVAERTRFPYQARPEKQKKTKG